MPYLYANPVAVSEGAGFVDFTVRLDAPVATEVRVSFQTLEGTAGYSPLATADFQYQTGQLIFAPGETSKTVRVNLVDNLVVEPTELFWLSLTSGINATVAQRYTPALIYDNDGTPGVPRISVNDVVVDETGRTANFFVSLDRPSNATVTVDFATADDTAQSGQDYGATSGTLSFAPGQMVQTVTVNIVDDAIAETDEFFHLLLNNPTGATIADGLGVAMIGRNDTPLVSTPYVTVTPIAVGEGDLAARFVVQLSAPSPNQVRLSYQTLEGTADYSPLASADFQYQTDTIYFAPGETTKVITVPLVDNAVAESAEVFWLSLYSPVSAVIGQRYTPALIYDNDGTTGTPAISVNDVVVDESAQRATFFVSLNRPSTNTVTVQYATADDTAQAGQDYRAASGTLSFAPGQMVQTVTVDIVDDAIAETDEFFHLLVSNPTGATIADGVGVAMIGRNDTPLVSAPYVTVTPIAVGEGDLAARFVVQLSAPSPNQVRLSYQTLEGTAQYSPLASADFQYQTDTIYFAPGETTKVITVPLVDNAVAESTEVFWLSLYSPVSAVIGQRYTPALIYDNDGTTGTPAISVNDVVVDESAQRATFFVSLNRPSTNTVTVQYATADDTAQAGQDYRAASGTLSFAPGQMVQTVTVDIVDDAIAETDEFFHLLVSNPTGATIADGLGVAMIGRNDTALTSTPYISVKPVAVSEGDIAARFVVQLSAPSSNEVRVSYQALEGTADYSPLASADFQYQTDTIYFAPGETTKAITVPLVDNAVAESTEVFWLSLYSPVNAVIGQRYTPALIYDNDGAFGTPAISVNDVAVDESAQRATFFVSLDRPSTNAVTVQYATTDGTALAGQDFRATSGTLSFAPGQMVQTVTVDIVDDTIPELDEFFHLMLSNPTGATIADGAGRGLIGRSDLPVVSTPYLFSTQVAASEAQTFVEFIVQLSAPSANQVRVSYQTIQGTAQYSPVASADFQYQTDTIYFAPGETLKVVRVALVDSPIAEPDENFTLSLYSPVNATVLQQSTSATIVDDDGGFRVLGYGLGDDTYLVTSATDRIVEMPGGGIDTVETALNEYMLPANVENLRMLGSGNLAGNGNALDNTFFGNSGDNVFRGGAGFDVVEFSVPAAFYQFDFRGDGSIVAHDTSGQAGTDTLISIEGARFPDLGFLEIGDIVLGRDRIGVFADTMTGQVRFTTSAPEQSAWLADPRYFYLQDLQFTLPLYGPFAPPGTTPIFRFYDPVGEQYFWTSDTAVRDSFLATQPQLRYEGAVAQGYASQFDALMAGALGLPIYSVADQRAGGVGTFVLNTIDGVAGLVGQPGVVGGVAFWL